MEGQASYKYLYLPGPTVVSRTTVSPLLFFNIVIMTPSFHGLDAWFVLQLAAGFLFLVVCFLRGRRRRLPLPPGPTPLPILGNIFDLPRKVLASEYYKLHERYGESLCRL